VYLLVLIKVKLQISRRITLKSVCNVPVVPYGVVFLEIEKLVVMLYCAMCVLFVMEQRLCGVMPVKTQ